MTQQEQEQKPQRYPLTSSQREIWFEQQLHPEIPLYNIGGYVDLPGVIDPALFQQAVHLLVQKHDALRIQLLVETDEDGVPYQHMPDMPHISAPLQDMTQAPDPATAAADWMQTRFRTPFTLTGQPLFRYDLIKLAENHYYWLLQYHHLILDGWGVALINRSLAELYTTLAEGLTPTITVPAYTDWIAQDRAYVTSETFDKNHHYWLAQYPTTPEPLLSPRHRSQFVTETIGSGCAVQQLPRAFYQQLEQWAKQHRVSLFHVFIGVLFIYFTRTTQREDFAIGLPVLNRAKATFKKTAGLFTGVSAAWFQAAHTLDFTTLVQMIQHDLQQHYRHQRFPVSELNRAVVTEHQRTQIFDINLSYENHDYDAVFEQITGQFTALLHGYEQTPLTLFIRDFHAEHAVKCDFVYNQAYFNAHEIQALQTRFVYLLEQVLENGHSPISQFALLTPTEQQQLITWNDTRTEYPQNQTLVDLFETQVNLTPNNIAISYEDKALSYHQLNAQSNQLAHHLHHLTNEQGDPLIQPDTLVGLCVERSLEMAIGLLGILKAGGAYVPLDPDYPTDRIAYMLADSQVPVILTQQHLQLPEYTGLLINLDDLSGYTNQPEQNLPRIAEPHHLAYVIYTSGSTGQPKGVAMPHRAITNLMHWQGQTHLNQSARTLNYTSLNFDVSCQELMSTWSTGGNLVLISQAIRQDSQALLGYLHRQQIQRLYLPYVALEQLAEAAQQTEQKLALKQIITAGEQLKLTPAIRHLQQRTQATLDNHYGPTESHVTSGYSVNVKDAYPLPPIGKPIANHQIHILDAQQQLQPLGIPGELCIAGVGLARGYLNRPELTAEKFIQIELFGKTERVYKTGDLARWLPDGNLEYLGRIDHQVKLRGFRIELGEIEAVLSQQSSVNEAVVVVYEREANKTLAAYIVTANEETPNLSELRERLKSRLPDYMIPHSFTVLDTLPLTPNGKIDRKALPEPEQQQIDGTLNTDTEHLLATIWSEVLQGEIHSGQAHFFELGGHSLLATQLASRIRETFKIDLSLATLFAQPILAEQARWLTQQQRGSTHPPIQPQPKHAPKPLSYAQQRLWFLTQLEGPSATYNIPTALHLQGPLNTTALREAFNQLVQRHDSLRHRFVEQTGKAQIALLPAYDPLQITDLTHLSAAKQQTQVQQQTQADAEAHFDLSTGPLFRLTLLQLSEQNHVLLLNLHHSIADGWSIGQLLHDWNNLYRAYSQNTIPQLAPLPIQYTDYAAWQREVLTETFATQQAYWQTQLQGAPQRLELPTDHPRPAEQTYRGAHYSHRLSAELTAELNQLSRTHNATLYMSLLTAFNILLYRYTGQTDLLVGSPIAGRIQRETEHLIGLFVNTLVLRTQIDNTTSPSTLDLLQQTRQTALAAYAHQDIPFEQLVEVLQPERSLSHSPIFQVMFALQNNAATKLNLPDLTITPLAQNSSIAKFDLTLNAAEINGQLELTWEYATDLFESARIERMAAHFTTLLTAISTDPTQSIHTLSLLTTAEISQLQTWNDTATNYPQDKTLVDLFETQADLTPSYIAVSIEGDTLTYRQLNAQSNQLAHHLHRQTNDQGERLIQPDTLVGLCVERSLEMIIGLLGILKAGGAYVPLDPDYPTDRIAYMLADSQVPVMLTQQRLHTRLPAYTSLLINLDDLTSGTNLPDQNLPRIAKPHHLAYVIYTSGSTGQPKGVATEHNAIARHCQVAQQHYALSATDRVLQFTSLNFDPSLEQMMVTWATGAHLKVIPDNRLSPTALIDYLVAEQITVANVPPAYWQQVCVDQSVQLPDLRLLILGGEALPITLAQILCRDYPQWRCLNAYGPTEATVTATTYPLTLIQDNSIPIGRPNPDVRIYILDQHQQLQPLGIPGELCIAGVGLARGYLNRPELTAEKFINIELFGKTERIYKTGDLARWLPDGNLEYLGRIDHQVKLRGFRIELGEIEAVLSQQKTVSEAIVVIHEREQHKTLAAYLTPASSIDTIDRNALRAALQAHLPDYMVPHSFTVLGTLPLTPNGKIDRKALPEPEQAVIDQAYQAARNPTEQQLVMIWSQVLKHDNPGIHDNFFELGGDSILSIQIVAQARQAGLGLTPRDLFQHQTIADLALAVQPVSTLCAEQAEQGEVQGEIPLTPIQAAFLARNTTEPHHYNQTMLLEIPADLNQTALAQAYAAVQTQHDAFRLRYQNKDNQWQQTHQSETKPQTLITETLDTQQQTFQAALENQANPWQASLDLTAGPLTRLVLFHTDEETGPKPQRLLWIIHHLIVDGVSWRILLADLQMAYQQASAEQPIQLPAKSTSFKAWSDYLNDWSQQATYATETAYWQRLTQQPNLPIDNPASRAYLKDTAAYTLTLSQELTEQLLYQAPAAYRTQINDLLLSALALMLHEWTGQSTHLIDLESHGRAHLDTSLDLSRILGWFTSLYSIALTLPEQPEDLAAVITRLKEQLRQVPHEGIGYGLRRQRGEALPQGQILFNYLGQFDQTAGSGFRLATETTGYSASQQGQRTHLIEINGMTVRDQLSLTFSYSDQQYRTKTIQQLAAGYQRHIKALVRQCQHHYGYTPSDFPLTQITQDQINSLQARYTDQIETVYPLSPMQAGMLFHSQYAPDSGAYVTQLSLQLNGDLNPIHLRQAWQTLIDRHPILRTAIDTTNTTPRQIVLKQASLSDITPISDKTQDFDLTQAPLMRVQLEPTGDTRWQMHWQSHHILFDGWSLPILLRELLMSYQAITHQTTPAWEPVTPYQHYIAWLQQQDLSIAQAYWQPKLSGFIAPTPIPVIRQNKAEQATGHKEQQHTLSTEQTTAWQTYAQQQRLTQNTLIQAGWAILLGRYSGETDIVFGATTSGRNLPLPGIEQMVGLFINTLPLRVDLEQDIPSLLHNLQTQQQTDNAYAYTPLADIQNWSDVPNGVALFDSLIVFENYPVDEALTETQPKALSITELKGIEATNYPITLAVMPGTTLSLCLSYQPAHVEPQQAKRLLEHLVQLIDGIVHKTASTPNKLPLLTKTEISQLQTWNDTATEYPRDQTIVDLFEAQVDLTPHHVAVSFEGETLTYQQLNAQSNRLAHHLHRQTNDQGERLIQPDTLVGISVERSLEMIIGLLGILKAGGAYVPLDPDYPTDRLAYMLADSQVPVLLTQQRLHTQLAAYTGLLIDLDNSTRNTNQSDQNLARIAEPHHLAYVIYTSGSTGKPKGVMLAHQGVVNLSDYQTREFSVVRGQSRILQFASISFDAAVSELTMTLLQGATLQLVSRSQIKHALKALIHTEQPTHITLPASAVAHLDPASTALQTLIVAGEACPLNLMQAWSDSCRFYNAYGPTEATVCASLVQGQSDATQVTIGGPIANTRIYLLDTTHQPVPIGIPGELCIAGVGLARGYLNRPELTAEKFINIELFGKTERVYKTGDLARWLPDGKLEYLGRIDHQVKLRGFRIELGEIETVLSQQASVSEAVVVVHERETNKTLAAYITTTANQIFDITELREALKVRLPDYMIPNSISVLDALPLTPNGKIDRKALPEPEQQNRTGTLNTDTEHLLAAIWTDVLACEIHSGQAHFFELGGHSLLATQLASRIRETFEIDLPLATLFAQPVLAEQARWLTQQQRGHSHPLIQPQPEEAPKPLSYAQQRLWFLAQLEGQSATYNMPAALRLQGPLNIAALRATGRALVQRHDSLRHRFIERDGDIQVDLLAAYDPLQINDLTHLSETEQHTQIAQQTQTNAEAPFDLNTGPLFRLTLLQLSEQKQVLLLNLHHSIADGWSINQLLQDWNSLYRANSQGTTPQLSPLPIQYTDYAAWQREALTETFAIQQAYWQTQLEGAPQRLELPADHPRPAQQTYRGAHYSHRLSAELRDSPEITSRYHALLGTAV